MWIDSHCHLNHPNIKELGTPDDIIIAAKANQTSGIVTICCEIAQEAEELTRIAAAHDNVWCTIGTHPHDAGQPAEKAITTADIVTIASHPKVIGIGETGLDYFYDHSPRADQKASFEKHLEACLTADLPVIIHARDADNDIAEILESYSNGGKLKGVLHCFSSGESLAKRGLDIGFYVSFSGIITFGEKSESLRAIAKSIPLDRLLVETDAPFLAPKPHRGKTNSPAFVKHTGEKLAEIHGIPAEDMAKITTDNFFNLFTKAA
jgi:TatD DNase family protein